MARKSKKQRAVSADYTDGAAGKEGREGRTAPPISQSFTQEHSRGDVKKELTISEQGSESGRRNRPEASAVCVNTAECRILTADLFLQPRGEKKQKTFHVVCCQCVDLCHRRHS